MTSNLNELKLKLPYRDPPGRLEDLKKVEGACCPHFECVRHEQFLKAGRHEGGTVVNDRKRI